MILLQKKKGYVMKQNWEFWAYQKGKKLLNRFPKMKEYHEKLSSLIKKECQKNNISLRFNDNQHKVLPDKKIRQMTVIVFLGSVFFILMAINLLILSLNIAAAFLCCVFSFVFYAAGVINADKFEDIKISEKLPTMVDFPINEIQKNIKKQKKKNIAMSIIGIVFFWCTIYLGIFRSDLIYHFLSEYNFMYYIPKNLQKSPILLGLSFIFLAHLTYSITTRILCLIFSLFKRNNIREL